MGLEYADADWCAPLLEAAVDPDGPAPERALAIEGGMKEGTYLPPGFFAVSARAMLALTAAAAALAAEAATQAIPPVNASLPSCLNQRWG